MSKKISNMDYYDADQSPRFPTVQHLATEVNKQVEPRTNQIKVPLVAKLSGKGQTITVEASRLLTHACRQASSESQSFTQIIEALMMTDPDLLKLKTSKEILLTIDRLSELHFTVPTITGIVFTAICRSDGAAKGRAKEVLHAYLLADSEEQIEKMIEDEDLDLYSHGQTSLTWSDPGLLRLLLGGEDDFIQILKLLLAQWKIFDDSINHESWEEALNEWKSYRWASTTDLHDYLYKEENLYQRVIECAEELEYNPPTVSERVIKLISNSRPAVIKRFEEYCRSNSTQVHKLTWNDSKVILKSMKAECDMKFPWNNPTETGTTCLDRCRTCRSKNHPTERCPTPEKDKNVKEESKSISESPVSNNRVNPTKPNDTTDERQVPRLYCDNCGKNGHQDKDCWKAKKNEKPTTDGDGQATHKYFTRQASKGKDYNAARETSYQTQSAPTRMTEVIEDESTAVVQTYMTEAVVQPSRGSGLPMFKMEWLGRTWRVLVDSGSACNFMNLDDLTSSGFEYWSDGPKKLKGVHDAIGEYPLRARFPLVVENKIYCFLDMWGGPARLDPGMVILGWPSMERMGITIRPDVLRFDVLPGLQFTLVPHSRSNSCTRVHKVDVSDCNSFPIIQQIPVEIELSAETPRVRTSGYTLPPAQAEIMDTLIDQFIAEDILAECARIEENMHVSPGFLISKKVEVGDAPKYRLLVDLRRINSRIRIPQYDIHTVAQFQRTPASVRYFAKFDIKNAFYSRLVSPSSYRILTMKTSSMRSKNGFRFTQWKRLPQGLCASPQYWCDRMDSLLIAYMNWLEDLRRQTDTISFSDLAVESKSLIDIHIRCYIDDGIVCGRSAEGVNFVVQTFKSFMEKNGHAVHKMTCAAPTVEVLGLQLSADGWRMSEAHSQELLELLRQTPSSTKELQSLLGSIQYCRSAFDFSNVTKCLATLTDPLYDKLKGDARFSWSPDDQKILDSLIEAYSNLPFRNTSELDQFSAGRDAWIITSDASNVAGAGVLYRIVLDNPHPDFASHEFHNYVLTNGLVVDCWSHRLSDVERRWPIHEREAFALIESIKKWQNLIFGTFRNRYVSHSESSCSPHLILLTDNATTLGKFLRSSDGVSDDLSMVKLRKWYGWFCEVESVLTSVPVVATHIAGTGNVLADLLSRKCEISFVHSAEIIDEPEDTRHTSVTPAMDLSRIASLLVSDYESKYHNIPIRDIFLFLRDGTLPDGKKVVKDKIHHLCKSRFSLSDNVLWIQFPDLTRDQLSNKALVVPKGVDPVLSSQVISTNDTSDPIRSLLIEIAHDISGHSGYQKSLKIIRSLKAWWPGMLADLKHHIECCATCNLVNLQEKRVQLNPICLNFVDRMKYISVDIVGPLEPAPDNYQYILSIVERYSGYCMFVPIVSATAECVAREIWLKWVSIFGRVFGIHSDQGTQFTSKLFENVAKLCAVRLTRTPPYHPQANGLVEKCHSTLKKILRISKLQGAEDWTLHLPIAQLLLNEYPRGEGVFSPAQLIFGIKSNGIISFGLSDNQDLDDNGNVEAIKRFAAVYEEHRLESKMRMIDNGLPNVSEGDITVNDSVYWIIESEPLGKGPFKVISVSQSCAVIDICGSPQNIHKSQLRKAMGILPSSGVRRKSEMVIFEWQSRIAVIGKIMEIEESLLILHEYEAGLEGKERRKWLPLWSTELGTIRSKKKPTSTSKPLLINCNPSSLLVKFSWKLTARDEVPVEVKRIVAIEF